MAASPKVLRIGLVHPVRQLDPRESADFVNLVVAWQVYETAYAPTVGGGQSEPLLLKEPLRPEPGKPLVLSAEIREGVRFSDGTPMTARHVADGLSASKGLSAMTEITAAGNRIVFTLKRPHDQFEQELSRLARAIVLEKGGQALGTGAYVAAPGSTPERMRLVRNPYYRDQAPIDEIEAHVFAPAADGGNPELKRALLEGRIDFTSFLRRDEIGDIPSVRKSVEPGTSTAILFFNTERGIFQNRLVRKAVASAIDRMAIAGLFHANPLAYTASGVIPAAMGSIPDGITHDLQRARQLLAEAKVSPSAEPLRLFTIWASRPYLPQPQLVAEKIAEVLKGLGFNTLIEPAKGVAGYYERTAKGSYDMTLGGWIPDTPDAADVLDSLLHSTSVPGEAVTVLTGSNISRLRSPAMDEALKRFREERTDASRQAIADLLREEAPMLPLMYGASVVVHSWRLRHYPTSFAAHPLFARMDLSD